MFNYITLSGLIQQPDRHLFCRFSLYALFYFCVIINRMEAEARRKNHVLILSGGSGSRAGSEIPKQYISAGGRMMISRCIDTLKACPLIDGIFVVAEAVQRDAISAESPGIRGFADPGENRQLSILNGLLLMKECCCADDIVLIQDAARPFTPLTLINSCISACREHDGAMPVIPMKDTVYLSEDGKTVSSLTDREKLFAGQAPEAFVFGKYLDACMALLPDKILSIKGSTEAAVIAGMDIAMIPGDETNFKVTTAEDLKRYEELCVHGYYTV